MGGGEELGIGIGIGIDGAGVAGAEGTWERHAGRARGLGRDMQAEPGDSGETCRQSQVTRDRVAQGKEFGFLLSTLRSQLVTLSKL